MEKIDRVMFLGYEELKKAASTFKHLRSDNSCSCVGGTLIMAFFYSINEPFQDVFLKILKVSLGFDLTSMYFGGLCTVYLCRQLGKRHK